MDDYFKNKRENSETNRSTKNINVIILMLIENSLINYSLINLLSQRLKIFLRKLIQLLMGRTQKT